MRLGRIVEGAVARGGAQRNVQMAALARNAVGPLRHERRHQAVALRENLGVGLEKSRAIGGLEGIAIGEGGFENPGSRLGVQSLDRKSHGLAEIEQLVIEIRLHGTSEHRVAECPGGHGLQLPVTLVAHGLRRLLEHEEFEFRRGAHQIPHARSPLEHAPQCAARADRFRAPGKLSQKKRRFRFEWNVPPGRGQDTHGGIGIGGVPAGERGVVIELVVRVPAEDHVAKSEILIERR